MNLPTAFEARKKAKEVREDQNTEQMRDIRNAILIASGKGSNSCYLGSCNAHSEAILNSLGYTVTKAGDSRNGINIKLEW